MKELSLDVIKEMLHAFKPVTLGEMDGVKLMNRVDTKFLIDNERLEYLLRKASEKYFVLETQQQRITPYSSIYFDTEDMLMYTMHHNGKRNRYKIRMRAYENSKLTFLEIKHKNNKGRTRKKRIGIDYSQFEKSVFVTENTPFINKYLPYQPDGLKPVLQNYFERITLVDFQMTERITIDIGLRFRNVETNAFEYVNNLVIIEVKQDGACKSAFRNLLAEQHVLPGSMSKYCLGVVLTKPGIKSNRFQLKIRNINKLINKKYATS